MIDARSFSQKLKQNSRFSLRRAVERLREGLFDPVAIRLLTVHEQQLNAVVEKGLAQLKKGHAPHLGICGSYGRGKSHSLTYIQEKGLLENYVTSMINLDIREIPLSNFRLVYRELISNIRFPGTNSSLSKSWKSWAKEKLNDGDQNPQQIENHIPENMPHLFRSILAAMVQKNMPLSPRQKSTKKHRNFRPREFSYLLDSALLGNTLPSYKLRNVLKYRQVPFYRDGSLSFVGNDLYLKTLQGLSGIFEQMGYNGWILLFDEGESVGQLRIHARSKGYHFLHQLLVESITPGLYPIVAFTEDFLLGVEQEDYEKLKPSSGDEQIPYFRQNYAEKWRNLTLHHLDDLSRKEWNELAEKLIYLHASAYRWQPPELTYQNLVNRLAELRGTETRYQLKALVDELDVIQQELSP